jgi:hypothetical protein
MSFHPWNAVGIATDTNLAPEPGKKEEDSAGAGTTDFYCPFGANMSLFQRNRKGEDCFLRLYFVRKNF